MPYKGGVQLLAETQRRPTLAAYTTGNTYFYVGVVISVVVFVTGVILGNYKASLNDQIASLDGQIKATEDARNKDQEQELVSISQQSKLMQSLLGSKIYWTQALGYLGKMVQPQVQMSTLDADVTKGTIGFQAKADNFAAVAKQVAAFIDGTGINDVSVDSIKSNSNGTVEFSGQLTINQKSMLNKSSQ